MWKIWGYTHKIFERPTLEMHDLWVEKGGYCSAHEHAGRWNWFYVYAGMLEIMEWPDHDFAKPLTTTLRPGDSYSVRPGAPHRFKALESTRLLELYWAEMDPNDIIRHEPGGMATDGKALDTEAGGADNERGAGKQGERGG